MSTLKSVPKPGSLEVKTNADWIANAIADIGCEHVYGGHGATVVELVNAIHKHPRLKWVYTRNEGNAALMACAQAKLTGKVAVCIATSGPGATNLTTGLMEACKDRLPILCLTGMKQTSFIGHSEFQDTNQSRLFAGGGLSFSKQVHSAVEMVPVHCRAHCYSRRYPGSTLYLHQQVSHGCGGQLRASEVSKAELDRATRLLLNGTQYRRVLIVVGQQAVTAGPAILTMAQALHAPILTRLDAAGVIDQNHMLSLGIFGVHGKSGMDVAALMIESADILLCVGVEDKALVLCDENGNQIRRMVELQHAGTLLDKRFASEISLVGDLTKTCNGIAFRAETWMANASVKEAKTAEELHLGTREEFTDAMWDALHAGRWKMTLEAAIGVRYRQLKIEAEKPDARAHPGKVLQEASHLFREGLSDYNATTMWKSSVLCLDTGDVTVWGSMCISVTDKQRVLSSDHYGSRGYGLCAGIAAILSRPAPAAAMVIAGDGGFQTNLQELATFQQLKRKGDRLVVLVLDNQTLGRLQSAMDEKQTKAMECKILGPDYVQLALAYGGSGLCINKTSEAEGVLKEALSNQGLTIVHVKTDPAIKADLSSFVDTLSGKLFSKL
eukprot:g50265.t1